MAGGAEAKQKRKQDIRQLRGLTPLDLRRLAARDAQAGLYNLNPVHKKPPGDSSSSLYRSKRGKVRAALCVERTQMAPSAGGAGAGAGAGIA